MKNIGILGFAHGHVFGYGGVWVKEPSLGIKIVAGWDHDRDRLEKSSPRLGGFNCEISAEALLARPDISAVVISSETSYHCELVEKAAVAGKAIVLYKPMALTLSEADRMVTAVEKHGVPFTMGWQMHVDPINVKIKSIVDSGSLGRTYYFRRRHCLGMHNSPDFRNTWHVKPELNRDIFADDSAHPADWIRHLFGVPETVYCEMSTMHTPAVPNDLGVALFRYPDGMVAEVAFLASCSAAEITTEGYFEKGAIQSYNGDQPGCRLPHDKNVGLKWFKEGDTDWTNSDIPLPANQGVRIAAQAGPLSDFICGRSGPVCTAREGRDSLRMVLACYLSARDGKRVRIDDPEVSSI